MFTEKEMQLLIEFTKNREKTEKIQNIVEESFLTLIKKFDCNLNIVDESLPVRIT